jgi:hypothetical protein
MKKMLMVILLVLMATTVSALNTDFGTITFSRVWNASDSTATLKNIDTLYTSVLQLKPDDRVLFFSVQSKADTDFTADSVYLQLQHSCDQINWVTYPTNIDLVPLKSADLDTVFQSALRLRRDSLLTAPIFIQPFVRVRAIYWDSTEANKPLLFGNTYKFKWNVFITTVK